MSFYSKQHYRLIAGVTPADCTPERIADREQQQRRAEAWKRVVAESREIYGRGIPATDELDAEIDAYRARRMQELGYASE